MTTPTSEREAAIRERVARGSEDSMLVDLLALLDAARAERDVARTERAYWKDAHSGERNAAKTARAERDALRDAIETALAIVKRTASMGGCSQTHHEHLAADARAALRPAADPAGDLRERIERIEQGGVPAYGFEDDPADLRAGERDG